MAQPVSVISLVDTIIEQALQQGASDIHFEPRPDCLRVRFRIDGILFDRNTIEKNILLQVCSRLKVVACIDISEKRIAQDGKFSKNHDGNIIDFRVSTFPSIYGQKIVVRILNRSNQMLNLESLGFAQNVLTDFNAQLKKASGFFLVSGPTGSGKTTTLYAALSKLNSPEKNIVTLEDPVEYNVEGITQGQINPGAGFTFERGIRSLLRQDPDVIMVGEIRDRQTARVALEAALTGHVVLSTVHTNDAPSVVMRLMDMGIEPYLINAALTGVLAQRLARKICSNCKKEVTPSSQEALLLKRMKLPISRLFQGEGCQMCFGLGYKGRIGIFEHLAMTNRLRSLIVEQPLFDTIYEQARQDGMSTLLQDGIQKVQEGVITLGELVRVIS